MPDHDKHLRAALKPKAKSFKPKAGALPERIAALVLALLLALVWQPSARISAETVTLGDKSSLLLGNADSHYALPELEALDYDRLDLNSLYILMQQVSSYGTVDYMQANAERTLQPGALTQLMTYHVCKAYAAELKIEPTAKVLFTADERQRSKELGGILSGLEPGDEISLEDLYRMMLMEGSTDAVFALLKLLGTSEKAFTQRMNLQAEALGMANTHFEDPAGISDKESYTCLNDIGLLLSLLLRDPEFSAILRTEQYQTAPLASAPEGLSLKNEFLSAEGSAEPGQAAIDGAKSGFSSQAGRDLLSLHFEGNTVYAILTAGAESLGQAAADHRKLLSAARDTEFDFPLLAAGAPVAEIPLTRAGRVDDSLGRRVVRTSEAFSYRAPLLTDVTAFTLESDLPLNLAYPPEAGRELGPLRILRNGEELLFTEMLCLPEDPKEPSLSAGGDEALTEAARQQESLGAATAENAASEKENDSGGLGRFWPLLLLLLLLILPLYQKIKERRALEHRRRMGRLQKLHDTYASSGTGRDAAEMLADYRRMSKEMKSSSARRTSLDDSASYEKKREADFYRSPADGPESGRDEMPDIPHRQADMPDMPEIPYRSEPEMPDVPHRSEPPYGRDDRFR